MGNSDRLWSKRDVADFLGCCVKTVERAVRDEGLPAMRATGRLVRFDPVAVRNWLARKRRIRPARQAATAE